MQDGDERRVRGLIGGHSGDEDARRTVRVAPVTNRSRVAPLASGSSGGLRASSSDTQQVAGLRPQVRQHGAEVGSHRC